MKPKKTPPLAFHWRAHNSALTEVRVWRSDWLGDSFEIMKESEFRQFQIFAKKFGFDLVFHDIEED